jgi:hypothetical protein
MPFEGEQENVEGEEEGRKVLVGIDTKKDVEGRKGGKGVNDRNGYVWKKAGKTGSVGVQMGAEKDGLERGMPVDE